MLTTFDCMLMFRCTCQTGGRDKQTGTTGSVLQRKLGNGVRWFLRRCWRSRCLQQSWIRVGLDVFNASQIDTTTTIHNNSDMVTYRYTYVHLSLNTCVISITWHRPACFCNQ